MGIRSYSIASVSIQQVLNWLESTTRMQWHWVCAAEAMPKVWIWKFLFCTGLHSMFLVCIHANHPEANDEFFSFNSRYALGSESVVGGRQQPAFANPEIANAHLSLSILVGTFLLGNWGRSEKETELVCSWRWSQASQHPCFHVERYVQHFKIRPERARDAIAILYTSVKQKGPPVRNEHYINEHVTLQETWVTVSFVAVFWLSLFSFLPNFVEL